MERMDVLRFDQTYPGWYFNPSRWQTADGYVPWRIFWLLYHEINRTVAQRQYDDAFAILLGIGAALGQDGSGVRVLKDFQRAHDLDG